MSDWISVEDRAMEKINTNDFVEELCEIDPNYQSEINTLEKV